MSTPNISNIKSENTVIQYILSSVFTTKVHLLHCLLRTYIVDSVFSFYLQNINNNYFSFQNLLWSNSNSSFKNKVINILRRMQRKDSTACLYRYSLFIQSRFVVYSFRTFTSFMYLKYIIIHVLLLFFFFSGIISSFCLLVVLEPFHVLEL